MKKMRKLIPAFAMLMVAAIMMSTASFAWFSMNTTATASGMQIKAKSTGGLAIASYTGTVGATPVAPGTTDYLSAATVGWKNSIADVEPTSHDGTNWYYAKADKIDNFATTGEYKKVDMTDAGYAAGSGYFIKTMWSIKSLAETGTTTVTISGITVTGTQQPKADDPEAMEDIAGLAELAKSIRIAIYTVDNGWQYFAPLRAAGTTGLMHVTTEGEAGAATVTCGTAPNKTVLTLDKNIAEDVEVYIYFEGEDEACKSSNAINLANLNVTLTFTASTPSQGS